MLISQPLMKTGGQLILSAPALFSAKYKSFFFRKFIASSVFMLERYIKRLFFFFFFREGFEFFFTYQHEKMKIQGRNEIFRQMTMTMTLTLIQNVI